MRTRSIALSAPVLALSLFSLLSAGVPRPESAAFERIVASAEKSLAEGNLERAHEDIVRALERDPKNRSVWALRTRWAEAAEDDDELVFSLHRELRLAVAQKAPRAERDALRERLFEADPIAADLLDMRSRFVEELLPVARRYESEGRPHSAIRVHREILSMDPDRTESAAAIQRLAAAPDPSLAEDAKAQDLLEGVSEEWIREHDEDTREWKDRAKVKKENYVTSTDAGYAVLIRASEAMEQMNSFYRQFFRYGTKEYGGSVPRIALNIFRTREEYLKITGAAEWTGGHFNGTAVNTYLSGGGFEDTVGTLFHEAAHQFVSLATNSASWLNEGLASFFEGCRILPNGTVEMNLPANNRLIPLVARLGNGWMRDAKDGIDANDPSKSQPTKAPRLATVIENEYEWGPPWYAPTWGLVYFFYNFQDPVDGRYLYRDSFWEFVNKSGGRVGSSAVKNFEEIVLGNAAEPTRGVRTKYDKRSLPETTAELDPIYKEWMQQLFAEQLGKATAERPYLDWARYAIKRDAIAEAVDHFEKGLREDPRNADLLSEFADLLADELDNEDRASKLVLRALQSLEQGEDVDAKRVAELEKKLKRWDPEHKSLDEVREELTANASSVVQRYLAGGKLLMTMDLARRLGTELKVPGMFDLYEEAARRSGRSTTLWRTAYNEEDLRGWAGSAARDFVARGEALQSNIGGGGQFDYRFLTVDTVTSGDFSLETEIRAGKGEVSFCGLVFGKKTDTAFHAALLFPGKKAAGETAGSGFVDVTSFYGGSDFKTWRHSPIAEREKAGSGGTPWVKLRIDVTGSLVDVWYDGSFVATQDFGSPDVLRGSFGLISGAGLAEWRDIRYLARPAHDPAAVVDRGIRLEGVVDEGGSIGGSWLGKTPPFPTTSAWVQGERASWDEVGEVPQLLVLFSIHQNDLIPLDGWLAEVARQYADVGLEIVCIASPLDQEALPDYLAFNAFPGAVGVDRFPDEGGIGITFEQYGVATFNLPRLILLDVDGKVDWEGDPGFKVGMGWDPDVGSFLDTPLEELISRRNLRAYRAWKLAWEAGGKKALSEGRLDDALPLLSKAGELDAHYFPAVRDAQAKLAALQDACANPELMARTLEREGAEPAMDALVEFSQHLDTPIDARRDRTVKALKRSDAVKDWKKALDLLKPLVKKARSRRGIEDPAEVVEVAGELEDLSGRFPRTLAEHLRAAGESSDADAMAKAVLGADAIPANWLMRDYFNW